MTSHSKPHVHLIGIGGSGLSAIARLLLERGYTVSGSDRSLTPLARELQAAGARVSAGHNAKNVQGADVVVRSSAVPDNNVEVAAALDAGIPVMKRAEFLGEITRGHEVFAVAGTHGKTSTTAMLAWTMTRLGFDPSYIIGGTAKNMDDKNAHAGSGTSFIIEADEYDRMFLGLNPNIIVITYLEPDHPDCFPTPEVYYEAFTEFISRLQPGGSLIAANDGGHAVRLISAAPNGTRTVTYGTDASDTYTARDLSANSKGGFDFRAYWKRPDGDQEYLASVRLQVPGEHNVRNALAVLAVVHTIHAGDELVTQDAMVTALSQAAAALGEFQGTGRRFDVQGEILGITVIDDYAHHPTEIQATLAAARARYPESRLWVVWQPHTFSRTRGLMAEFAASFKQADRLIVTDIYAARENASDFDNFSAAQVVEATNHPSARFIPDFETSTALLLQHLQPGDVLLVLSAGDADQISQQVLAGLKKRKN